MQWRKPIADRDSGIRVELTLIYPPFRNPANLETKSRLRGYETGLMEKYRRLNRLRREQLVIGRTTRSDPASEVPPGGTGGARASKSTGKG